MIILLRFKILSSSPVDCVTAELRALDLVDKPAPPTPGRSRSAVPNSSPPCTPKAVRASDLDEPFIRNRKLADGLAKLPNSTRTALEKCSKHIGKLVPANRKISQRGIGSGILIDETHFLCAAHCIDSASPTDYRVVFDATDHFSDKGQLFKVASIFGPNSLTAYEKGLRCGELGDFAILELEPDIGETPGERFGFTPISTPSKRQPEKLFYLGYNSGSHLKISSSPTRRTPLTESSPSQGQLMSWNQTKTIAEIDYAALSHQNTPTLVRATSVSGREISFEVKGFVITRDSGAIANSKSEFYLENHYIYGSDHVISTHKTGDASSGGFLITENGELFAMQIGRFAKQESLERTPFVYSVPDCVHHLASYPWKPTSLPFLFDLLDLEGRGKKAAATAKAHRKASKGTPITVTPKPLPDTEGFSYLLIKQRAAANLEPDPARLYLEHLKSKDSLPPLGRCKSVSWLVRAPHLRIDFEPYHSSHGYQAIRFQDKKTFGGVYIPVKSSRISINTIRSAFDIWNSNQSDTAGKGFQYLVLIDDTLPLSDEQYKSLASYHLKILGLENSAIVVT